ncbi:MAG: hypothetical protein K9N23_08770, partial [Akkermansiaceae bacterium]|nr:hypothetical protein [Akkermansiaceae bacterium]
ATAPSPRRTHRQPIGPERFGGPTATRTAPIRATIAARIVAGKARRLVSVWLVDGRFEANRKDAEVATADAEIIFRGRVGHNAWRKRPTFRTLLGE